MLDIIRQPWPWYVSGILIALIMIVLLFFGKSFGFSSNLRTICSACGAGSKISFFDFNWKDQKWNLLFLIGAVIGGFISSEFLTNGNAVNISEQTIVDLRKIGISPSHDIQPPELFALSSLSDSKTIFILLAGGFLVGFGSRWAGGCTSGHAITGLSNLQFPSLLAVAGFFAGGLVMTHYLLPYIL
ncbi:MAG: YeeE/YedE family protein [Flammeovirgaceae bacterium]|nr:YeeE/YedE family protein [Flammeovirgaceae bacterium]